MGGFFGVAVLAAGLLVVPAASAEELPSSPGTSQTKTDEAAKPAEAVKPPTKKDAAAEKRSVTPQAKLKLAPAAAGDASISLTATQQTGTEPFQNNDNPGNDSGPDNDIVRTNDTVSYNLGVRFEGADQTAPTVKFTIPRGQELVSLPPFCLAGSTVTPQTLGAPAVPLTGTSWLSLPRQEVVCKLKDQPAGTSLNYPFITKVRAEVPNATVMDPMVFSVTSDQVETPVASDPLSQKVSSVPKFDLSKRLAEEQSNQGPLLQWSEACADDASRACQTLAYPVTVSVPDGGKGIAPLASPIKFTENLNPASFYGASVWANMVSKAGSESAARSKYAPRLAACYDVADVSWMRDFLPYSRIGNGANSNNSVRESGTASCSSVAPGENPTITIVNTDTTAATVPTTTGSGSTLPNGLGLIVSFQMLIQVPIDAVMEFGGGEDGVYLLSTKNEYIDPEMKSIDGQDNTGENLNNNTREGFIRFEKDGALNKSFTGIYGAAGNTPAMPFNGTKDYEGPPGSGTRLDGNTVVMPGQAVQSVLTTSTNGIPGGGASAATTLATCDVWDPARLALAAHPDWHGSSATSYPSNGKPVYPSFLALGNEELAASTIGSAASGVKNLKIEYSSGPAGPGNASDCSSGTWVTDPSQVSGAKTSTDSLGRTIWTGVNRVRVTYTADFPTGTTFGAVKVDFAIGQVVLDSKDTSPIGNWGSQMYSDGFKTVNEVIADPNRKDRVPSYDPATHKGTLGDRLIPGKAIVRVKKFVENPTTGEFVDTAVPQYTSGATVRYRLDPSLSTSVKVQGSTAEVIVEDCLPKYQLFKGSTQGGKAITPELVQMGAPNGSELKCGSDQQYVRWNLGELPIGEPIPPIIVSAEVLDVARNGTYTNDVLVSSPVDQSSAAIRSDDVQMQLVVPTGIKISKTVNKSPIEVNPAGVTKPRTLQWSVFFANLDAPANVSNVDVIDVLPANGLNGNTFKGQLRFDSAAVAAGTGITIEYTKAASGSLSADPANASNGASGSTVWCDAVKGSVVSGSGDASACPQTAGDVTGLRFKRAGAFTPSDQFQVNINMTPVGNHSGDHYRNITAGKVDGVSQGVGPAARTVDVVASKVGDRVWEDLNKNGLQDDGEPGVAGFPVRLVGTDVDGNPVDLTTVTDKDGKYLFSELASGKYRVIFDPNGLKSNTTFTRQHAGSNTAIDSDANTTTGQTQEFDLGVNTEDLTLDAGLIIDRNSKIVIDKKFLKATPLDNGNRSTVTYDIQVSNKGTAETTYDLADKLRFGGSIEVNSASVKNTAPGGIVTNDKFDGLKDTSVVKNIKLRGGETHTYRVTVNATVKTTITVAETQCWVTKNEQGGGFLNEAQLTVDGKTVSDKGCGEVPKPKPKPKLPITGGAMIGFGVWTALGAAVTGAALLLRRRQKQHIA